MLSKIHKQYSIFTNVVTGVCEPTRKTFKTPYRILWIPYEYFSRYITFLTTTTHTHTYTQNAHIFLSSLSQLTYFTGKNTNTSVRVFQTPSKKKKNSRKMNKVKKTKSCKYDKQKRIVIFFLYKRVCVENQSWGYNSIYTVRKYIILW